METKICKKCGEVKPLTRFVKSKEIPSGRTNTCLNCWGLYRKTKSSFSLPIDIVKEKEQLLITERAEASRKRSIEMTCTRCGKTKPITDFLKSAEKKIGYKNPCKACSNLYIKTNSGKSTPIETVLAVYEQQQKTKQENRAKKLLEMTCTRCKQTKPLSEFYRTNSTVISGRSQPCKTCAKPIRKEHEKKPHVRERTRELSRLRNRKLRQEVLLEYGSMCACCDETEPKFLSVDHVHNDGNEHRKETGMGGSFYHWLKKNGFPKDRFQLLCFNCNFAKGHYGLCPHQKIWK